MRQIEILDYAKNKVIKSICFINDALIPDVVVHSEANIISYLEGFCIHICKTEKGRIKWENYYQFKEYDEFATYRFIAHNLIAIKTGHKIDILFIDSKSVALHTVIQHPLIGFLSEPGLEYICCESACKDGNIWGIHPLGNNRFGIVECVCSEKFYSHGQQRVSVFKLENLQIQAENVTGQLPSVDSIKFTISKSIIFEEFRDQVKALDVFDDHTFGMFITEKGRLFRIDLKDYSIKHIMELKGLVKRDGLEIKTIDKLLMMAEDRVIITIKTDSSPYSRIVILALDSLQVDFDSDVLKEETEEEGEYKFYDVVKMRPNRTLVSFKKKRNGETLYNLGGFYDDYQGEYDGYSFGEYGLPRRDQIMFDRLWHLEGFLIAMRHGENVFHLSFLDLTSPQTVNFLRKKKFQAQKFVSVSNSRTGEILDVRSINKDIVCIQIKLNDDETEILVYNIETEKVLNKIKSKVGIIGPITHGYEEDGIWRNMQKMMIFGDYKTTSSGIVLKPVKDVIDEKLDDMESSAVIYGFCITARNFKTLKAQDRAQIYESDHHKNFICVLKSPKFKFECLKVMEEAIGNIYHKYIEKNVFEMIFGVNDNN